MELVSKTDFQTCMLSILESVRSRYSEGNARVILGHTGSSYDEVAAQMESFARPIWGLAPFFHGGGTDDDFASKYVNGLINGTNPNSDEYWGDCTDYDQRFVEMAALAFALALQPAIFWDPLTEVQKDNLSSWLAKINVHEVRTNNWKFFAVLVNVAFKKLDRKEFDQAVLDASFEAIETCYLGDGWYRDGTMQNKDYYNPFAFHYYGLLYSTLMAEEDPERTAMFKERATRFAQDFIYWFTPEGAGIPFGRSLTYRFAQVAFFSACLYADIEPLPLAVMKGIVTRNIQYWLDAPIFDNGGILTIGYLFPNLVMAENYNAPGSPYWALKSFVLLALPDSHDFWDIEAAPLPDLDEIYTIPKAEMVLTRKDGEVVAFPSGLNSSEPTTGHQKDKYAKFAYSTKYGFSVRKDTDALETLAADSDLVFEVNGRFCGRETVTSFTVEDGRIVSEWSPFDGITVKSVIEPAVGSYKRTHTITSEFDCVAYDTGFALPHDSTDISIITGDSATVEYSDGFCTVEGGEGVITYCVANTNVIAPRTVMPAVKHIIQKGEADYSCTVSYA
ncbi:MAG: DUF2264 domain-containing protein [Lachnospiraceae bacterium]